MLTRTVKGLTPRRSVSEGANDTPITPSTRGLIPFEEHESALKNADTQVLIYSSLAIASRMPALCEYVKKSAQLVSLSKHPAWLHVLQSALGQEPYIIEATAEGQTVGYLPLVFLDTILFGKFLVSLPYLNTHGVVAANPAVQTALIDRAVSLADELNVRNLELRHEAAIDHEGLNARITSKVHMRLSLPGTVDELWESFCPKVRNQVRKGKKNSFTIAWGGTELLVPFYEILTRNMRDLGTPVYGIELFQEILAA
ncbi:MAG TPA: hypothetical protein VG097_06935, partial [Gemmata sp.]|nr:hypothetical protein [Gemmata sp.]